MNDSDEREKLLNFLPKVQNEKSEMKLIFIWTITTFKNEVEFFFGNRQFLGELNLVKFLSNQLGFFQTNAMNEAKVDEIYNLSKIQNDMKSTLILIESWLRSGSYLSGSTFGLLDLVSYAYVNKGPFPVPEKLRAWTDTCASQLSRQSDEMNTTNDKLFAFFDDNQIEHSTIEHPEVFTVETMMPYLKDLESDCAVAKNLFLKDKKGKLYLLSAVHDKPIDLSSLAKKVKGSGGLRFASEDLLFQVLGVKQGCVTAYALINDVKKQVIFMVDEDLINDRRYKRVYFHPLRNNASTGISSQDLSRFVSLTGHEMVPLQL